MRNCNCWHDFIRKLESSTAMNLQIDSYQMEENESKVDEQWKKMDTMMVGIEDQLKKSNAAQYASTASWIANWFLLAAKLFVVIISGSKAVTAGPSFESQQ